MEKRSKSPQNNKFNYQPHSSMGLDWTAKTKTYDIFPAGEPPAFLLPETALLAEFLAVWLIKSS